MNSQSTDCRPYHVCVCVNVLFNCIIVINLPVAKLINFRLATFKILFFLSFFFLRSLVRQFGRRSVCWMSLVVFACELCALTVARCLFSRRFRLAFILSCMCASFRFINLLARACALAFLTHTHAENPALSERIQMRKWQMKQKYTEMKRKEEDREINRLSNGTISAKLNR